mgnify:FL=1
MFKFLWHVSFKDGHTIEQPADDRYSKHDDNSDYNPSAFRDVLDYSEISPIEIFSLHSENGDIFAISPSTGEFFMNGTVFRLEGNDNCIPDRKLIYYRTMCHNVGANKTGVLSYSFGYEGKNINNGKIEKKVVTIQ